MELCHDGEVSRPPSSDLRSTQSTAAISSLNDARCHTLEEYAVDMPLNQVILPLMRDCFFDGAICARFCCCRRVMAISSLAISLASSPKSRGRDLPGLHKRHYPATPTAK